jgi:hypothetical protein
MNQKGEAPLVSGLCTEASLTSPRLLRWVERLRPVWDRGGSGLAYILHRKVWEWAFIAEALDSRNLLQPGSKGLGFGVGRDPLAALFASLGCEVVATDLEPAAAEKGGWVATGQFAGSLEAMNEGGICDEKVFRQRVSFRTVDMRRIPSDLSGFDFTWSACALEHLGSIALGQEFVLRQMDCLRPGGTAAHTTEYNVFSANATIARGETVLFRRRDIEWLVERLRAGGHSVEVDFDQGNGDADHWPPWSDKHLKLQIGDHVSTSIGLVVEKSRSPAAELQGRRWPRRLRRRVAVVPSAVGLYDSAVAVAARTLAAIRR